MSIVTARSDGTRGRWSPSDPTYVAVAERRSLKPLAEAAGVPVEWLRQHLRAELGYDPTPADPEESERPCCSC